MYRAQRVGTPGVGVGESLYGIGIYYTTDRTVAEKYAKIVPPVHITGPKGTTDINLRDAFIKPHLAAIIRKIGGSIDDMPGIMQYIAGQTKLPPEGIEIKVGTAEIIQKTLNRSLTVPQTAKAQYKQYDLKNIEDINQLRAQGIIGTSYTQDGVVNYVMFPNQH